MSALIDTSKKYVKEFLKNDLPSTNVYHNYAFAKRVVKSTEEFIEKNKISANESEVLVLASLFYTTGYVKSHDHHGPESVKIATAFLQAEKLDKEQIKTINKCILVGSQDKDPETDVEKIMRDVVSSDLKRKKYISLIEDIKQESELFSGEIVSQLDWLSQQIDLLTKEHSFLTDYAIANWKPKKEKNINKLLKAREKLRKGNRKEKIKAKYKAKFKGEDPERGIQTFYRVALRNHIKLSDIADTKANILLSVNAIIISLILSNLISKLDNPTNSYMIIPTIIFVLFSIASMVLSILATRPNVTSGEFTKEDVQNKSVNLTFFGNFHKMELEGYEWAIKEMIQDKDYIYSALAKDLYFLGVVLHRKYRILRITYTIFMTGIIVSVIAFAVMFKAQGQPL
tara:strand:- start:4751 stop:5947 length:1197 start_codon:yes stop_codon:yes gene_type:complete